MFLSVPMIILVVVQSLSRVPAVVKKKKKKKPLSAGESGDLGSIPGPGRSPGGGNGNPLQYSCLENSMDRGAWRATVHRVAKESDMTWRLNHQ